MEQRELIPHLFRTEYRKIVSALCKRFGFEQMEIAEDIASDTFMTAAQTWGLNGVPQNPAAWLYHVAKNKAKTYLHRNSFFENKIAYEIKKTFSDFHEEEIDLSPQNINERQPVANDLCDLSSLYFARSTNRIVTSYPLRLRH